MPTSAISSPTPWAASGIWTWASAAEYWALMTSFFVRRPRPGALLLVLGQLVLLRLELLDLVEDCSSPWITVLRSSAARKILAALGQGLTRLRVELHELLLVLLRLHLQALLGGHHVGDPLLHVLQQLDLLLVAVVQRLTRVLGPVQQLRDLRLMTVDMRPANPGIPSPSKW